MTTQLESMRKKSSITRPVVFISGHQLFSWITI